MVYSFSPCTASSASQEETKTAKSEGKSNEAKSSKARATVSRCGKTWLVDEFLGDYTMVI